MNLESGMLLLVLFFTCMLYATIGAIFSLFDPGTCMNLESGMLLLVLFFTCMLYATIDSIFFCL